MTRRCQEQDPSYRLGLQRQEGPNNTRRVKKYLSSLSVFLLHSLYCPTTLRKGIALLVPSNCHKCSLHFSRKASSSFCHILRNCVGSTHSMMDFLYSFKPVSVAQTLAKPVKCLMTSLRFY